MTQVDPDPYENEDASVFGDRRAPAAGDPTDGGKRGEIGAAPSVTADEPDDAGSGYPVGGGTVGEEPDAPPSAATGA